MNSENVAMEPRAESNPKPAVHDELGTLFKEREVADIIKVSPRLLQEWRSSRWRESHPPQEWGPAFIRVGGGKRSAVRYPYAWLTAWLKQQASGVIPETDE